MIDMTTFVNPFIIVIIIFAIIGGIGFLLTKNQLLDLKEVWNYFRDLHSDSISDVILH